MLYVNGSHSGIKCLTVCAFSMKQRMQLSFDGFFRYVLNGGFTGKAFAASLGLAVGESPAAVACARVNASSAAAFCLK